MPGRLLVGLCFFACFVLSAPISAQVRMVSVDPQTAEVVLRNFGAAPVDVTGWWMCESLGTYRPLNELTSGSLNLAPGGEVTVTFTDFITPSGQGVGLYEDAFFSLEEGGAQYIRDYMQYLTPDGFREPVAVAAGIWPDDDMVEGPGPYIYNGDGNQNGAAFWATLGTPVPSLSLPGGLLLVGAIVAGARRARRTG